jgi:hypothetical protein
MFTLSVRFETEDFIYLELLRLTADLSRGCGGTECVRELCVGPEDRLPGITH